MEQATDLEIYRAKSTALSEQVDSMAIVDDVIYEGASALLADINEITKVIVAHFKPQKEATHNAHKVVCRAEKEALGGLKAPKQALSDKMSSYVRERREAEHERQRNVELELKKLAEERQLKEAVSLEEQGKHAAADRVLESPPAAAVRPAERRPTPKMPTTTVREPWVWQFEPGFTIEDVPRELLMVDEKKVGQLVRAMQSRFNEKYKATGIRAYQDTQVVPRSR